MAFGNRLINTGGGAGGGTTLISTGGGGGMFISFDDGVTWANDSFTGITPSGFTSDIVWTGVNFVTQDNGDIFVSPDGIDWSQTLTTSYAGAIGLSYDPVANEVIFCPYTFGSQYAIYRSLDGGLTWDLQRQSYDVAYLQGVASHNGYAVISGRNGQLKREGISASWQNTSTGEAIRSFPMYNNGVWSSVEDQTNFEVFYSTSATPNYISTWSKNTLSLGTIGDTTKPAIDGVSTNVLTAAISGVYKLFVSTDKGITYTQLEIIPGSYTGVGYHNGKFYYKKGSELWTWENPTGPLAGTNVKVSDYTYNNAQWWASQTFLG